MDRKRRVLPIAPVFACMTLVATSPVDGQVGDFDIRNPLGFEPLLLHSSRGHAIMVGALVASLLLSDAGDRSETKHGMIRTGSWVFFNDGSYDRGYGEHPTNIFTGRVGFAYFLRDWLAAGLELHANLLSGDRPDHDETRAFGGSWLMRWHVIRKPAWTTYLEYGAGLLFSDDRFPPTGTATNFTSTYGIGAAFRVSEKFHVTLGARHFHLSNMGLFAGGEREPFDSVGLQFGYVYHF